MQHKTLEQFLEDKAKKETPTEVCENGCKSYKGYGWLNQGCPKHRIKMVGAPIIKDEN